jgi:hypothetical protein
MIDIPEIIDSIEWNRKSVVNVNKQESEVWKLRLQNTLIFQVVIKTTLNYFARGRVPAAEDGGLSKHFRSNLLNKNGQSVDCPQLTHI